MTNIELFDLCDDLEVPRIPYSPCPTTWARWKQEGKHTCIHGDGYVSVDYPEAREECITVTEWLVSDTTVMDVNSVDINIYFLVSRITIPTYRLYFLSFKDGRQLVSGVAL